jgi:hypothetical protein
MPSQHHLNYDLAKGGFQRTLDPKVQHIIPKRL